MAIQPRSTFTIRVQWQHRTDDRIRFKIQDGFGCWAKYVFVYSPQPNVWPNESVNKMFPRASRFRTQHPRRVDDFGKGHAVVMVRPTLRQDLGELAGFMDFRFFPDPKKGPAAGDLKPVPVPIEIGAKPSTILPILATIPSFKENSSSKLPVRPWCPTNQRLVAADQGGCRCRLGRSGRSGGEIGVRSAFGPNQRRNRCPISFRA